MTKRLGLKILLAVIIVAFGFIYLLRSCLAKFDERSAIGAGNSSQATSQFLVFEKEGKGVIFSLVKYDRTVSYSQQGGMTRKSVNSTYHIQANDLATAEKTGSQKIKKGSQVKSHPVELLGASDDKAWLFVGELMAFDPFTLEKKADAAIIEEKNPVLKGKLIHERRYYEFDPDNKQVRITAADGAKYILNTSSLMVTSAGEETTNEKEARFLELDKQIKTLRTANAKAYDRLRQQNQRFQQKQISMKEYKDSSDAIRKEVSLIDKERDSLESITRDIATLVRADEDDKRRKENARRNGTSFNGMKINSDTMDGRWYGLYSSEDLQKISDRFNYNTQYSEEARNKLVKASITVKDSYATIGEDRTTVGAVIFLQGGFLMNKETGIPFHLGQDFLIVYKDRIGNEGLVQLARIGTDGKQKWTISTGLKEFYDWQLKGERLIVAGTDNKNLSSGEVNVMQIINLSNGGMVVYDFFKDKIRSGNN